MRYSIFSIVTLSLLILGCNKKKEASQKVSEDSSEASFDNLEVIQLTTNQANQLIDLPMACVVQEYPNKLGQTLESADDLAEPTTLHPAFYGCFDWHSAVHGHWSMVRLLKEFPNIDRANEVRAVLASNMSTENIHREVAYFEAAYEKSYERTYGWAWLLKLQEELHNWDDPLARELEENLAPLSDLLVEKYLEYLPKLQYAVRVGTHSNTAFGLSYAWDYAVTFKNEPLQDAIRTRAIEFFGQDKGCPITWEPGGADFLSPCLEEINLMRRIYAEEDFVQWLTGFMPEILETDFSMPEARVGDRSDGQSVHLDGLNFSRAWVFYGLAKQYPEEFGHLTTLAHRHLAYSFPNLFGDGYEGGHWLGTFALYALSQQ